MGGICCCCRPLYLNNCTSWFMGFREVLCVSFAAAPGIRGTSFPHDQYSERFTSGAKICSAWIWIYIYLFFLLFSSSSIHLLFLLVQLFFDSRGCYLSRVLIYVVSHDFKGMWLQRMSEV